jgi:16S rRNA (uracil1498-N3)-methyltransferase
MHHFYSTDVSDSHIRLDEEESRHCTKVMRLSLGDEIIVFDGKGKSLLCRITEAKKQVSAEILKTIKDDSIRPLSLTLAVSPTKSSDRMEWMVEKLVELGIARIVFIKTEKGERSRINEIRLFKKAVSAMKQSGNLWLPSIETEVKFKDFIVSDTSEFKYVAHCFNEDKSQIDSQLSDSSISMLIGPEGDFSNTEVNLAQEAGFEPISLGLPRYRTETAAVVACTLINHFNVTLK